MELVSEGCTFYDSKITSLLPKRYAWARNTTGQGPFTAVTEEILNWQLNENAERFLQESVQLIRLLSLREKEILLLIAKGRKNTNIAKLLNISISTIESHKTHILKKLDLKSTTDLLIFAVRNETILKFLSTKNILNTGFLY